MTNRRGRPTKSALGQTPAPKVEEVAKLLAPELESVVPMAEPPVVEEPVEEKGFVYGEDYVDNPDIERVLVEKVSPQVFEEPVEEVSTEVPLQDELPDDEDVDDGDFEEEEEKPPRTLKSLGKAELRLFQRTGIMPK